MLKQSENIVHRLFNREISRPRPNTHVQVTNDKIVPVTPPSQIHQARRLYENIVPNHTIYDIECPDQNFRRFTNDGQFLICFGRNHQDLIVYRHKWLSFCVKGEHSDQLLDLPPKAKRFESQFSLLYTISLATGPEAICKDFFLSTENGLYGIFATSTIPDNSSLASDGAVPGVPSAEKITIFIVSLAEGRITDERCYRDDFIHLAHNMGVFLYNDLLAILSIRFQCIRILQIRETGRFVDVQTIGTHCREDDELVLNSQAQEEELFREQQASLRKARGLFRHDASVSGKVVEQGHPWPLVWNLKRRQSSRRERRRRQALSFTHDTNGTASDLGTRSENGHGYANTGDPEANGNHNGIQGADIDLQYENYFRGLLVTLQDTSINEVDGYRSTSNPQDGMNWSRQRSGVGSLGLKSYSQSASSNGGGDPQQNVVGSGQFSAERTGNPLQTPASRQNNVDVEHRTADNSLDSVPTSTSGSSLNRYSSRRESSSAHYTSTSISTEGIGSPDVSFLGASGRAGANGSVSANSETNFEYVDASSRMRAAVSVTTQQIRPEEQRPLLGSSSQGRSQRRGSRSENGRSHENTDEPNPDARSLPVSHARGQAETNNPLTNRADFQIEAARRAQMPVREDSDNGNSGGPRDDENADLATGSNEAGAHVLSGIKQRLLSFIYQGIVNEETSSLARAKNLKRFYYHFQHYVDLVMWKVQFLDQHHLLIKFGSLDGVLQRNSDTAHQTAFFAIFNLETTEMLGFYKNSAEEILLSFEQFCDHFRVAARYPLYMNFVSSFSNNTYVREQLRQQRMESINSKTGNHFQFVKRMLAWIPFNSQCQSPSAYYDQSLFHYDEKLISAVDRHHSWVEHPIKFISRRMPNCLKFKLSPGPEHGANNDRTTSVASIIFHPIFPFAISIQQSSQPSVVNFHFRK